MGSRTYFATELLMDKAQFLRELEGCIKVIEHAPAPCICWCGVMAGERRK